MKKRIGTHSQTTPANATRTHVHHICSTCCRWYIYVNALLPVSTVATWVATGASCVNLQRSWRRVSREY